MMGITNVSGNNGFIAKAWRALASMRLFCILAFLIAFWFSAALLLYLKYFALFKEIDRNVLIDWLFSKSLFGDPVRIWLLGLIALIALLGLNLAACMLDDFAMLLRLLKRKNGSSRFALSKLSILVVHLSYIIILSGHLTTAVSGYRLTLDIAPGKTIGGAPVPFTMRCDKAEIIVGMRGRLMATGVMTMNPGRDNEEKIVLKPGKSIWYNGVMIDMEAKTKRKASPGGAIIKFAPADATPAVRLTKNYGLYLDAVGGIIFFIGIIMRMMFRKEQSI
ncbi:MAG: hypothetical protein WCX65_13160 [bacterium]